jgi:uncharacterized protein YndB with AHSA1/START domain
MSTTSRSIAATPEQVWSVLADGWLYPLFVVGAARMREVDDSWPAVGSRLHHSVGGWPVMIDDTTEVLEVDEGRRILLLARAWPAGQAHVEIVLRPEATSTVVTIVEQATGGPGALIPKPLQDVQLHARNLETLQRLAFVAEGRSR